MYKIRNYDNVKEFLSRTPPLVEKSEEQILREEYERRLAHRKRTKNFRVHPQHRCQDCNKPTETDAEHRHHMFCSSCWEKRKRENEGVKR